MSANVAALAAGHGSDEEAVREDALNALEELTAARKEGDLLILGEKAGKIARKTHRVEYNADRGRWSVQFTSGEAFEVGEEEFAKPFASASVS